MKQEDLQSKARSELSALKIIGIDPESLQKEMRIKDTAVAEEAPVKEPEASMGPAPAETGTWLPERGEVSIPNKFHKSLNVIQDIIQRYLSGSEYKVYDQLKRLSWGGKQRVNWVRIGNDGLRKRTGIQSRKGVADAIGGLVEKKLIFYATGNRATSDATDKSIDRNNMGTVYIVPIPTEGALQNSTLWNSILRDRILNNSTLKSSILPDRTLLDDSPGILNDSTLPNSIPDSKPDIELDNGGVLKNSILPNYPNKEDSLKDSLSEDPVKLFYTGIGQQRISKMKREKGNSVLKELQKEGFSPDDIQFAIEWTLKPGNTKEKVHDFSIIPHTIGQALAAREAGQQAADAVREEEARVTAAEEARKRLEGEIEALRSELSKAELAELREQAEREIAQTDGMKKEFINEPLIVAKENEILRRNDQGV